jgi:hypothetical protein
MMAAFFFRKHGMLGCACTRQKLALKCTRSLRRCRSTAVVPPFAAGRGERRRTKSSWVSSRPSAKLFTTDDLSLSSTLCVVKSKADRFHPTGIFHPARRAQTKTFASRRIHPHRTGFLSPPLPPSPTTHPPSVARRGVIQRRPGRIYMAHHRLMHTRKCMSRPTRPLHTHASARRPGWGRGGAVACARMPSRECACFNLGARRSFNFGVCPATVSIVSEAHGYFSSWAKKNMI